MADLSDVLSALKRKREKGTSDPNQAKINYILQQNADKNFVQRILNYAGRDKSPTLDMRGMGTGNDYGTHYMTGNAHPEGGQMAYPQIVETQGNLRFLSPRDAYDYALKTGEYIKFPDVQDVNWFGKNYKKGSPYGDKW